ncbi:GNAT family N-acetyltransferase [Shouchella shacheensis]|uniref:GNAT family N-acetyltransferase n=1 Tax=Shouchella shacheensis TaxID=1649580 RepID=UPI0007404BAD|nr:GNAT family protein [Shouchella shacheensis]
MKKLVVKPFTDDNVPALWKLLYGEEEPEWKKWDAPYFRHEHIPYKVFKETSGNWVGREDRHGLFVDGMLIGFVSYYWESEATRWLEVGIIIFDPTYWSGGFGSSAMNEWIDYVFRLKPEIERVGFTTWSGNNRMMGVGEKLGMKLEGRMRKCRYYDGVYYDSVRYGVLREEWEVLRGGEDSSETPASE